MEMIESLAKNNVTPIAGNIGTWFATAVSWQAAQATLTFIATVFSITVSLATLLWIVKQWRDRNREQEKKAKE